MIIYAILKQCSIIEIITGKLHARQLEIISNRLVRGNTHGCIVRSCSQRTVLETISQETAETEKNSLNKNKVLTSTLHLFPNTIYICLCVGGCLSDHSWRYRGGSDQVFGPGLHGMLHSAWQGSVQKRPEQVGEHV